jgi:DNA repair exonuclease SbcCD ATPase subunit
VIKRVQIIGLRGKDFDLELGPMNLIIGPNRAGKTTIADAIRWGVLGYIPGMNTPPRGWAELIGNGTTGAQVALKDVKGAATWCELRLEKGVPKVTRAAERATDVNVLTLDPKRFFAQTGPVRAQMVAEASASQFDWKVLIPEALQGSGYEDWERWQEWIGHAMECAKNERSEQADKRKMLTQTLRGLESLRGLVIEDGVEQRRALTQAQQSLGKLGEQLRAVTEQVAKAESPVANEAESQLDAVRRALQQFIGREHDEESYADRLKDAQMKLEEATVGSGAMDERTVARRRNEMLSVSNDLAVQQSRITQLEEGRKTIEAKYAKLKKAKGCPTCGATGKMFAQALKTAQEAELGMHGMHLEQAMVARSAAAANLLEAQEALAEAEKQLARISEQRKALIVLQEEAQLIELWKAHDNLLAGIKSEAAQIDVQGLRERQYEISCEIEDATEAVKTLEHHLSEINYRRSQKRQLADVDTKLAEAEAFWQTANKQVSELEALRERFTAMSLEPVLERLATFTAGIFHEQVTLDGTELGRIVGSRWVPLTQFSGSEQAVAVAGLTCALQGTNERSIVLADELSSFDDQHLEKFLANVSAAIKAGILTQFIGFSTPRKKKIVAEGLTTILI